MTIRNVSDAKAQLSSLLVLVEKGEEVIIARAGKPVAKLVAMKHSGQERKPGALKGKISSDFDAPDLLIEKMFYGESD